MAKRAETQADKMEKKAYLERKKKLFEFEKTNYGKIVFLRGTKGYWLVGGHSAIILVNKIAPEIKVRMALKRDTDFDIKFKEGVINLKNLGFYKERLDNSVYLERGEETEDYFFYKLKTRISEKEFDLLFRSKEIQRQKLQSMIEKSVPMPKLMRKMNDVLKLAYRIYLKRTDATRKNVIVPNLLEDIRIAHKTMLLVVRAEIDKREGLRKVRTRLELAMCDLIQIMELEVWTVEDCTMMAVMIIETKRVAENYD
ncbi:hypothetical protein IJH66_03315 [Candidatus Saccharibacteria bacterium]|nr:hypothetical protein [Candidatus Saccharibacteria bacterium]